MLLDNMYKVTVKLLIQNNKRNKSGYKQSSEPTLNMYDLWQWKSK